MDTEMISDIAWRQVVFGPGQRSLGQGRGQMHQTRRARRLGETGQMRRVAALIAQSPESSQCVSSSR